MMRYNSGNVFLLGYKSFELLVNGITLFIRENVKGKTKLKSAIGSVFVQYSKKKIFSCSVQCALCAVNRI